MRKLLLIAIFCFPSVVMANLDEQDPGEPLPMWPATVPERKIYLDDCTVIGHKKGTTVDFCLKHCERHNEYCAKNPDGAYCDEVCVQKSLEECTDEARKDVEYNKYFQVFKCPVNQERLNAKKCETVKGNEGQEFFDRYIDNNGEPFDLEEMLSDKDNVYIFRAMGLVHRDRYEILTPDPNNPDIFFCEYY